MIASARLAREAVRALLVAGVTHVVVCPGSRSAPLAYALESAARESAARESAAREPAAGGPGRPMLLVRHDERSAAFVALGVGKAGGLAAVVTTSGTAVANLHPAVLEAHHAGVPLVVVTADRPPQLRGTWANQTSELQAGVFGAAVRARVDLADTSQAPWPIERAVSAAWGSAASRPGPVHLNLGFTDPLVPDADSWPGSEPWLGSELLPAPTATQASAGQPAQLADGPRTVELAGGPRTVVVAGDGAGPAARVLAESAGWPLLAEPSSGARGGPMAIDAYRLLLELPELGGAVQRVVAYGRPTLSRPVTRLLDRPDVEVVLVSLFADWPEPGRPVTRATQVTAPNGDQPGQPDLPDLPWLRRWQDAGAAARKAIDEELASRPISGPLVAHRIAGSLQAGDVLVAAASNPIRDLDLAAEPFADGVTVLANRGLSGIDGTISTALGVALSRELTRLSAAGSAAPTGAAAATGPAAATAPVRLLIGDLAFLHDANALLAEPGSARPALQIVVVNDGGGGIFSLLEHGARALDGPDQERTFERMFGTPQDVDLAALCAAYGVPHQRIVEVADLDRHLAQPASGTSVLELNTSRDGLRDLHAELRARVHASVRAQFDDVPG